MAEPWLQDRSCEDRITLSLYYHKYPYHSTVDRPSNLKDRLMSPLYAFGQSQTSMKSVADEGQDTNHPVTTQEIQPEPCQPEKQ
jgi:hypothetical protein